MVRGDERRCRESRAAAKLLGAREKPVAVSAALAYHAACRPVGRPDCVEGTRARFPIRLVQDGQRIGMGFGDAGEGQVLQPEPQQHAMARARRAPAGQGNFERARPHEFVDAGFKS